MTPNELRLFLKLSETIERSERELSEAVKEKQALAAKLYQRHGRGTVYRVGEQDLMISPTKAGTYYFGPRIRFTPKSRAAKAEKKRVERLARSQGRPVRVALDIETSVLGDGTLAIEANDAGERSIPDPELLCFVCGRPQLKIPGRVSCKNGPDGCPAADVRSTPVAASVNWTGLASALGRAVEEGCAEIPVVLPPDPNPINLEAIPGILQPLPADELASVPVPSQAEIDEAAQAGRELRAAARDLAQQIWNRAHLPHPTRPACEADGVPTLGSPCTPELDPSPTEVIPSPVRRVEITATMQRKEASEIALEIIDQGIDQDRNSIAPVLTSPTVTETYPQGRGAATSEYSLSPRVDAPHPFPLPDTAKRHLPIVGEVDEPQRIEPRLLEIAEPSESEFDPFELLSGM